MKEYFNSVVDVYTIYPSFIPQGNKPEEKISEYNNHKYTKIGNVEKVQDSAWKVGRVFKALGLSLLTLVLVPLAFGSFRKLLHRTWREVASGTEKVSLYLKKTEHFPHHSGQQGASSESLVNPAPKSMTAKPKTSLSEGEKVEKASTLELIEQGKLDHDPKALQSLSPNQLAALRSISTTTLKIMFPNPVMNEQAKAELRERLKYINPGLICKKVENGDLDFCRHILQALTKEQLSALNNLSKKTLLLIISRFDERAEVCEKLSCIKSSIISKLVEQGHLDDSDYILQALSDGQLESLTSLSRTTFTRLFSNPYGDHDKESELKARMKCLHPNILHKAYKDDFYQLPIFLRDPLKEFFVKPSESKAKSSGKASDLPVSTPMTLPAAKGLTSSSKEPKDDGKGFIAAEEEQPSILPPESENSEQTDPYLALVEEGGLDHKPIDLYFMKMEQLAGLKKLKKSTLLHILPNPAPFSIYSMDQEVNVRQKLDNINKSLIISLVEKGELDDCPYILQVLHFEHLEGLKSLSKETLTKIFPNPAPYSTYSGEKEKLANKKLEHIDKTLICRMIEKGELDDCGHLLGALPNEHLTALNRVLSRKTLTTLFPPPKLGLSLDQKGVARLKLIPKHIICQMIENGVMDEGCDHILDALPSDHLTALTRAFSKKALKKLIPHAGISHAKHAKNCERAKCIPKKVICSMIENGEMDKGCDYIMELFE